MLLLLPALAAAGDLQIHTRTSALGFAEAQLEALDPVIAEDEIRAEMSCYDAVGVRDLNLDVPIETATLYTKQGELSLRLAFGPITGADMVLFGEDSDTFDTCAEFEAELRTISLTDAVITASLTPGIVGDRLSLEWASAPLLTGDLDTDIAWFPDDLTLLLIEDLLLEAARARIAEGVPSLLEAWLGDALTDGEYGALTVTLSIADVTADTDGLRPALDAEISSEASDCVLLPRPGATGRSPTLPLDSAPDSDLVIGITELAIDEALTASWEAGLFCGEPERLAELAEDIAAVIDPDVAGIRAESTLAAPPTLVVSANGAILALTGQSVTVLGAVEGVEQTLMTAEMDLIADAQLGFAPEIASVVLSLTELQISFTSFETPHIQVGMESLAARWLEAWLADALADELAEVVLFDALYRTLGLVLRLDAITPRDGGLELAVTLFDADDPEVDGVPPDTQLAISRVEETAVELSWGGTDDREGPLAWSHQVDGAGWQTWTDETTLALELDPGTHEIAVKARDAWLNEDPTPAKATVEISTSSRGGGGCCSSRGRTGLPAGLVLALAGLSLAVRTHPGGRG